MWALGGVSRMLEEVIFFQGWYHKTLARLAAQEPVDRGEWQAQKIAGRPEMRTCEIPNLSFKMPIPLDAHVLAQRVGANLPWAEDHFEERVSGKPLNPPPSNAWWPFAKAGNAEHKRDEKFSHTYPERFWPKFAGSPGVRNEGIRYEYGDLDDLVQIMVKSPFTRQAYLPIWFPEDIGAMKAGERVPCTLGYHFMVDPRTMKTQITYHIRSCDMIRHFPDDVYMAGRLLQWVCGRVAERGGALLEPDSLVMHIVNAHIFAGDVAKVKSDRLSEFLGEWFQ